MITFVEYNGYNIYINIASIDGGYVSRYDNTTACYANFYLHGEKVSYRVDEHTAQNIEKFFLGQKEIEL